MDVQSEAVWIAAAIMTAGSVASSIILRIRHARARRESDAAILKSLLNTDRVASFPDPWRPHRRPQGSQSARYLRRHAFPSLPWLLTILTVSFAILGALSADWLNPDPLDPSVLSRVRPVDYPKARNYLLEGPVSHYRDGDTIEVKGMAVRFARLDCPEMNTGAGARAKWAIMELTRGKVITCRLTGNRTYDRWVGTCLLPDGRTISQAMVHGGYCSWYGVPNFRPVSKDRLMGE